MSITAQILGNLGQQLANDAIWVVAWPLIAATSILILQLFLPKHVRENETYKDMIKLWSILSVAISATLATRIFFIFSSGNEALDFINNSPVAQKLLFSSGSIDKEWFKIGAFDIKIGVFIDHMAATVLFMAAIISVIVNIFSWSYMKGKDHIVRYYCLLSLFAGSMFALVISDNFLTYFISWEIMGVVASLLVGFYYHQKMAVIAQRKMFLITRIGSLCFAVGIFIIIGIWLATGQPISFRFDDFTNLIREYGISDVSMMQHLQNFKQIVWGLPMYLFTAAAIMLFIGAVSRCALFPLHSWLSDATEAPTPVNALVHAAFLVVSGVYLIARTSFVFDPMSYFHSPALVIIAYIGAFTALISSLIALTQYDIKKILSYAAISQLGYMALAFGVGSVESAVFLMVVNAWFMALLFLAAGSVIHSTNIRDIRYMGGLSKLMPITFLTFLAGTISLISFPLTSGFFAKELVLRNAIISAASHPEFVIIAISAATGISLTAFFMSRLIYMVFMGNSRSKLISQNPGQTESVPKESALIMLIPMILLSVFAVFFGGIDAINKVGSDSHTVRFSSAHYPVTTDLHSSADTVSDSISENSNYIYFSFIGVLIAVLFGFTAGNRIFFTEQGRQLKENWKRDYAKLYDIIFNKFYFDQFLKSAVIDKFHVFSLFLRVVDDYIIDGLVRAIAYLVILFAKFVRCFDQIIVDGIVNGVGSSVHFLARVTRYIQSGYVQNYYMLIVVTILLYMIIQERGTLLKFLSVARQVWQQMKL